MANVKQEQDVGEIVALAHATKLGQAVSGSSSGSRYVCVVISKNMNMAARIIGNGLSVRVEPAAGKEKLFSAAAPGLLSLGLTVHEGKPYASVHMAAESPERAIMGLAAMMTGFMLAHGGLHLPLAEIPEAMTKGV